MSELKGQLLGIILVITLFATISTCVTTAFGKYTSSISSQTDSIVETITPEEGD